MKNRLLAGILSIAAWLPLALPAAGSAISIHAPYVRLVPPGIRTTGIFMRIDNAGADNRRLLKVESPVAGIAELHSGIDDNGIMRMRKVESIAIPARGQTELKPGGYHIMLIDLKAALKEGENVPITLYFDDGSHRTILAPARRTGAGMPANAPAHDGTAAGHTH